ncbi:hypothetical protein L1987_01603 [Smallanthus sonchifolius]|uniref:Uncharacterized protein n=1 Tax=Smallanthus sonchifolius TaxID=185202 RepID=A0ACB9K5H9_9ASTR|nr:hypothetical protein L1987_01603 [Smallanthus sonchifolius]
MHIYLTKNNFRSNFCLRKLLSFKSNIYVHPYLYLSILFSLVRVLANLRLPSPPPCACTPAPQRFTSIKDGNSFMAIGCSWDTVDGSDPSVDKSILVQTASEVKLENNESASGAVHQNVCGSNETGNKSEKIQVKEEKKDNSEGGYENKEKLNDGGEKRQRC